MLALKHAELNVILQMLTAWRTASAVFSTASTNWRRSLSTLSASSTHWRQRSATIATSRSSCSSSSDAALSVSAHLPASFIHSRRRLSLSRLRPFTSQTTPRTAKASKLYYSRSQIVCLFVVYVFVYSFPRGVDTAAGSVGLYAFLHDDSKI